MKVIANSYNEIENIITTTQEFNKLTSENIPARLKQANLVSKTGIPDIFLVIKTDFDDKIKDF